MADVYWCSLRCTGACARYLVLVLLLLLLLVVDVEVTEVVRGWARGDDVEPVTDLLLLQVLLGQVLEVPAIAERERGRRVGTRWVAAAQTPDHP